VADGRRVTLYHAPDCHLCERALEVVSALHEEFGFELELVDADLEARYRQEIPVVVVDGRRSFTYFVDADALRARLAG
jgi:glutaredoxin